MGYGSQFSANQRGGQFMGYERYGLRGSTVCRTKKVISRKHMYIYIIYEACERVDQ